jgi:hypothetical protein
MSGPSGDRGTVREPAGEELIRAEAELVRAIAAAVEFGRTERAWRLAAELAAKALLIAAAAAALLAGPIHLPLG